MDSERDEDCRNKEKQMHGGDQKSFIYSSIVASEDRQPETPEAPLKRSALKNFSAEMTSEKLATNLNQANLKSQHQPLNPRNTVIRSRMNKNRSL